MKTLSTYSIKGILGISITFLLLILSWSPSFSQNQTKEYYYTKLKSSTKVGYWAYLPSSYKNTTNNPLIIFLHGQGEIGSNLDLVPRNGPPKLIKYGKWPNSLPFIVISPQLPSNFGGTWNPDLVNEVIELAKSKYKVDASRIYVTGFSLGGNGAWLYGEKYPDKVAAIAPMSGWGDTKAGCNYKKLPIWAFHGKADSRISYTRTRDMVNAVNSCGGNAKGTYPDGVGHTQGLWEVAYKPDNSTYNPNLYDWFLTKKSGGSATSNNEAPHANAGGDKTVTLPDNSITLYGSGWDNDGNIMSYSWSKVSGPSVSMSNASTSKLSLNNLVEGKYTFQLTVKDDDNASNSDQINVTVSSSTNEAPHANAGGDKTVILPDNNITLYGSGWDSDGKIVAYFWSKISGPSVSLGNASTSKLSLNNLVEGKYTFKLTVKDDDNASQSDQVNVTVKSSSANDAPHANAGGDKTVTLPDNNITLYGSGWDSDGKIVAYAWSKVSGPSVSMGNASTSKLSLNNLVEGKYTFKLTVKDDDNASQSDQVYVTVKSGALGSPKSGTGLNYSYYEGNWGKLPNFNILKPKKSGTISTFSLAPKVSSSFFGFRFEGFIEIAKNGEYTFYTSSDDGSKLYINGKEVVNNDGLHGEEERAGKIYLTTGMHSIKVEYFEKWGDEILKVKYAGPGITKQAIPNQLLFKENGGSTSSNSSSSSGLTYKYFEGSWNVLPDFNQLTPKKQGTIGDFSLSPKLASSNFGFEFSGYINIVTPGNYTFYVASDDGSKLYIDDKPLVNNDGLHGEKERAGKIYLTTGMHAIKVEYFEKWGDEILKVKYAGPGITKQAIPKSVLFQDNNNQSSASNTFNKEGGYSQAVNQGSTKKPSSSVVYPNAVSDQVNVEFQEPENKTAFISIFNQTGKVYHSETNKTAFKTVIDLTDKNMRAGIYFLKIRYENGESEIVRIIKE